MRIKNLSLCFGIGVMAVVIVIASVLFLQNNNNHVEEAKGEQKKIVNEVPREEHDFKEMEESPAMVHQEPKTLPEEPKKEESKESKKKKIAKDSVPTSVSPYNFHSSSVMEWPVRGNVVINYNMESMVYFPTMDEYRYSDFIAIEAEEGTNVKAGAAGKVTKIEKRLDTGLTITMKVGPEYYIVYGQLKDCILQEGDEVKRGDVFAKVGKVTSCYTKEGNHLFLQVLREKDTENPMSFLANSQ